jgi:hypothetical protein
MNLSIQNHPITWFYDPSIRDRYHDTQQDPTDRVLPPILGQRRAYCYYSTPHKDK